MVKGFDPIRICGAIIVILLLCATILVYGKSMTCEGARSRNNNPPNVVVTSPMSGGAYPDSRGILFDASQTTDADGDPLSFTWTIMMFPPQPGPNMFPLIRNQAKFTETLDVGGWMVTLDVNDTIDSASELLQITVIQNNPPTAVIAAPGNDDVYTTDDVITFDATGSADPDGDVLTYDWKSSLEGNLSGEEIFSTTLSEGTHTISLMVEDIYETKSEEVEVDITVRIPNYPPTIFITSPGSSNPRASDEFEIRWSATDANINDMLAIDLFYNTDKEGSLDHPIASDLPNVDSYVWDISGISNGKYYVKGVVTDEEGATGTSWSGGYLHVYKNYPPAPIKKIDLEDHHAITPTLIWNESSDPNGDAVSYLITIGLSAGENEIVDGESTNNNRYRITTPLEYNTVYYGEVVTKDNWEMTSGAFEFDFKLVNHPPITPEIVMEPSKPTSKTSLRCILSREAVDVDDDPLTYIYKWYLKTGNSFFEEVLEIHNNEVPSSRLHPGDLWKCEVWASDGHVSSDVASTTVTISNLRPVAVISSPIALDGVYTTNSLKMQFAADGSMDVDGDELSYRWESNLDGVLGSDKELECRLSMGTHLVTLRVSDGEDEDTAMITVVFEPVEIMIEEVYISPQPVRTGGTTIIYASLRNVGGDGEDLIVEVLINGNVLGSYSLDFFPHGTLRETTRFEWTPASAGEYTIMISVDEITSENTITVVRAENELEGTGDAPSNGGGGTDKGFQDRLPDEPWFYLVIIALIGIVLIFSVLIYKEKEQKKRRKTRSRSKQFSSNEADRTGRSGLQPPYVPLPPYASPMQTYLPPMPFFDGRIFEAEKLLPLPAPVPKAGIIDVDPGRARKPSSSKSVSRGPDLNGFGKRIDVSVKEGEMELEAIPVPAGIKRTDEMPTLETIFTAEDPSSSPDVHEEALLVECYKCGGDIPVTSDERPLVVICPQCGTEGELS